MTNELTEEGRAERQQALEQLDRARQRVDEAIERAVADLEEAGPGTRPKAEFDAAVERAKADLAAAKAEVHLRFDALRAEMERHSEGDDG